MDWIKYFILDHDISGLKINILKQGLNCEGCNVDIERSFIYTYLDNIRLGFQYDKRGPNYLTILEKFIMHTITARYYWYYTGDIALVNSYNEEGLYEGYNIKFYDNKKIRYLVHFTKGKKHGYNYQWHINGNIESIENYDHGKKKNLQIYWNEDGALSNTNYYY